MLHTALVLLLALAPTETGTDSPSADLREAYDVLAYDLDLEVSPEHRRLSGEVTVHARVVAEALALVRLDLVDELTVHAVRSGDVDVAFTHEADTLVCVLPAPLARGAEFAVTVDYSGSPRARDSFSGFHWAETADGRPWINTSCQGLGAHSWWPCKASYWHPDDKPERVSMAITVPKGLYAVSNGRLVGVDDHDERATFRWRHDYPLETYTVTLNVAPYVVTEGELELEGYDEPLRYAYYVLPENAEKAAVQFAQVPELLEIFTRAFGPWPFPDSKFGLVETNFWGMEHSTAVAYGSSYPAWCEANGVEDRYARRNRFFDYILVHEVAHEWWGNAVSTDDWGDFWIHEGFGTYAEGVYVEFRDGRERADEYFDGQRRSARSGGKRSRLYRGEGVSSGEAYSGVIYSKGAVVLETLRVLMDDDEAWWRALREFNLRHRYGNASSEDFRAVLEEVSGRSWEDAFASWVYGEGYPLLSGRVEAEPDAIRIVVHNASSGATDFDVPLDVAWTEGGERRSTRVTVGPGDLDFRLSCSGTPTELALPQLHRVFGDHSVEVP